MLERRGYQFKIIPTSQQMEQLSKTFGCVRFVYNQMLDKKIKHYEQTKKSIQMTPASFKEEYPFLKEVDSLALANVQLHLESAFKKFFKEKKVGFPKWKCKHNSKHSYTTNMVNGNIKLYSDIATRCTYIKLPKVGAVRIQLHRLPQGTLKAVTLTKQNHRYNATCLFQNEIEITQTEVKTAIGLDYAQGSLYVDSNGTTCTYPHYYRLSEAKLKREQRKLSKMMKRSKNYGKQKNRLAKLHIHIAQQRKDFLHKESRKIANSYDLVAVESIDMKALSQTLHLSKNLMDNGFGMFRRYLKYKLEENGKQYVEVDRWYASSQICQQCGNKHKIELDERTYHCPKCGYEEQRDINAAKNIRDEGMRMLTC